jgi:hypothetical protein
MKKKDWLAGLGLIGVCTLCCTIPLLGGAVALGISSVFLNPVVVTMLALVFVVAGALFISVARKTAELFLSQDAAVLFVLSERG